MAIANFPSDVPNGAYGVSGGPQVNNVSFEPEVGPTIDRRRASSIQRIRDVEWPRLTQDEYNSLVAFIDTTLYSGTLPFMWIDPFDGVSRKMKFVKDGGTLYKETLVTPYVYRVSARVAITR